MLEALHLDARFSESFMNSLLARTIDLEEDLSDQLFNHSEKRLACALLKLTRQREHDKLPNAKLPRISQKMLADMIGTTRSKVGGFMNKFRKLGLIAYKGTGTITVKAERMTEAVLHD
jgi:CRP-like cAMP-binding protein